jgi:hypothetical protein
VFTQLLTAGQQKPEHERQIRPLIGLPPEQVRLAWDKALSNAGGKKSRRPWLKGRSKISPELLMWFSKKRLQLATLL